MIATTCPHCGKPTFGRTDTAILERLQAAQEPMTAAELTKGRNLSPTSWRKARDRINAKLVGFQIVNVETKNGIAARYRLQKIEPPAYSDADVQAISNAIVIDRISRIKARGRKAKIEEA